MPVLLASLPDSDLPPVGECWQVIFKLNNLALAIFFDLFIILKVLHAQLLLNLKR